MKRIYLTILFSLAFYGTVTAQSLLTCSTYEYQKQLMQQNPDYRSDLAKSEKKITDFINDHSSFRSQQVINIPVVFHILYNFPIQNISDAKILEQLDVLNNDFNRLNADTVNTPAAFAPCASGTGIHFCLAQQDPNGQPTTGILHTQTSTTTFPIGNTMKFTAQGGDDAWPTANYLNIWVCNLSNASLGLATFPGAQPNIDGVVVNYGCVGGPNMPGILIPTHLGRVLTHMAGHWLNLNHFTDNCDSTLSNACSPAQQVMPSGCPSFPQITCNNGPNGNMFMNFMQGVDDSCMNMFTNSQSMRMNAAINMLRSSLLTSTGCVTVGINEINHAKDFRVFPNPFSTQLNIRTNNMEPAEFILHDVTGRRILQQHFVNAVTVNTEEISSGFYFLELVIEGERTVRKIVKE